MTLLSRLLITCIAALALAGCAYKPLKAPCSADEGEATLGQSDGPVAGVPTAFIALDHCGPMRPI